MATNSRFAIAVHVLTLLARYEGEPVKSEFLAQSVNTNPVVIRRLLCALAQARLVNSQTGAAGGSWLAEPSERVTLWQIYRAVEPSSCFALPRQPPSKHCPVGRHIEDVMSDILRETDKAMELVLSRFTVADVLAAVGPCGMPAIDKFDVIL